jgi:hypothetical protein
MDERAGEQLLFALCRGSTGDVHLDLAELDSIDVLAVIALLRGAATLCDGRQLVLHNAPTCLRGILDLVKEVVGDSGVRVE